MYVGDRQGRPRCACTTSCARSGREHLAELRAEHDALPELERPWLASRIELMETTDMAVVVCQGQNEIADLERARASTSARTARG